MAISIDEMINRRLGDLVDPFVDKSVKDEWYESQAGYNARETYYGFWSKPFRSMFTSPPGSSQGDDLTSAYIGGNVHKTGSIMFDQLNNGVWGEDAKDIVYKDYEICSDRKGKRNYWRCLYHGIEDTHIALDTDDYTDLVRNVHNCKKDQKLASLFGRGTYIHELDQCIYNKMGGGSANRLSNIDKGHYCIDFAKLSDTLYEKDQVTYDTKGVITKRKFIGPTGTELNMAQFFSGYDTGIEDTMIADQKEDLSTYATQAMPSFEQLAFQEGSTGFEEVFGEGNEMYKELYAVGSSRLGTETVLDILGERGRWAEDFYNTVADLAEMDQFTT